MSAEADQLHAAAPSHTRTVMVSDPVTMRRPSGENATLNRDRMSAEAGQLHAAVRIPHPHRPVSSPR